MLSKVLIGLSLGISLSAYAEDSAKWYDKIKVNGDFRFRHEYVSKKKKIDNANIHRERLRARLQVTGQVNEDVTAKIRIASSDGASAISNNTTMTDNASKKAIYIDLANIDWAVTETLHTVAGKQENPLRAVNKSELIYDSDYTPEGLSASWSGPLFIRGAGFVIQERAPDASGASEPDSWLLAGVAGMKMDLGEGLSLTAGGGYHDFTSLKKNAAVGAGSLGNSMTGARYVHDYQVGEVFVEGQMKWEGTVVSLFADAIQNFGAEEGNTAVQSGVQVQFTPITIGYSYLTQGKDSTLSAANNSDLNDGIDGAIGHTVFLGYAAAENTNVNLTIWHGKVDNSGDPFWIDRAALDLAVNF